MKAVLVSLALVVAIARVSFADSLGNLSALTSAVTEMCIAPDRSGQHFSVVGSGSAGLVIKLVDIDGEFNISQEEWAGLKDAISDRPDTRECVRFLVPILADKIFKDTSNLDVSGKILYSCRFDNSLKMSISSDGSLVGQLPISGIVSPELDSLIGEFFISIDGMFFKGHKR